MRSFAEGRHLSDARLVENLSGFLVTERVDASPLPRREHAEQVARIFIRDVTGEDRASERYRKAFAGLPAEKWLIFDDPSELPALQSIARP